MVFVVLLVAFTLSCNAGPLEEFVGVNFGDKPVVTGKTHNSKLCLPKPFFGVDKAAAFYLKDELWDLRLLLGSVSTSTVSGGSSASRQEMIAFFDKKLGKHRRVSNPQEMIRHCIPFYEWKWEGMTVQLYDYPGSARGERYIVRFFDDVRMSLEKSEREKVDAQYRELPRDSGDFEMEARDLAEKEFGVRIIVAKPHYSFGSWHRDDGVGVLYVIKQEVVETGETKEVTVGYMKFDKSGRLVAAGDQTKESVWMKEKCRELYEDKVAHWCKKYGKTRDQAIAGRTTREINDKLSREHDPFEKLKYDSKRRSRQLKEHIDETCKYMIENMPNGSNTVNRVQGGLE